MTARKPCLPGVRHHGFSAALCALLMLAAGCRTPFGGAATRPADPDDQTFSGQRAVYVESRHGKDPRVVLCPLKLDYIGPQPEESSDIPTRLPFWSDVDPQALGIQPGDTVEFTVYTDWDTARPVVITALRKLPPTGEKAPCMLRSPGLDSLEALPSHRHQIH